MFTIFTDGSCNFNKKGSNNVGGYAFVILNENGIKIKEGCNKEFQTTNNRMELMAVISALESMKDYSDSIIVNTDSEYVSNAINLGWLKKWKKNNYKKGNVPQDIPNKDLWIKLEALLSSNITFKWIKGHTIDNVWNNYVDKLAGSVYDKNFKVIN
jgi:ribonuclease HI